MAYEQLDITKPHSFTGMVKHIDAPTDFGIEIVVTNEGASVKYPNYYTFKAFPKNNTYNVVKDSLSVGDMITVKFFVIGKQGTSKAGKYYHFNEFVIAKDGIQILRKATKSEKQDAPNEGEEAGSSQDDFLF